MPRESKISVNELYGSRIKQSATDKVPGVRPTRVIHAAGKDNVLHGDLRNERGREVQVVDRCVRRLLLLLPSQRHFYSPLLCPEEHLAPTPTAFPNAASHHFL